MVSWHERELNTEAREQIIKVTLSVIKADIGGYVGYSESHPDIIIKAEKLRERFVDLD